MEMEEIKVINRTAGNVLSTNVREQCVSPREVEAEELTQYIGHTVRIHGSIYKVRKMSGFAFVLLRTKREIVQCVYSEEYTDISLEKLVQESCVILTAAVVPEERARGGYELQIKDVEILSVPEEASPVVINQKRVDTSLEHLLDYRPVTLRNDRERAIFRIQAGLCEGFRRYLVQERFTEIHTPKIVAAGAEGGANIFRLNYFGKEAYLAQSPQFYKQMMVGVFERVFEIAPVFRAEKHDTSRHLNEYTSVDFEMGYIRNFEEIMEMETCMIQSALAYLKENYSRELELLHVRVPEVRSIPALRFAEAKEWVARAYNRKIRDGKDFEPEEEKLLCELVKKKTGSEFVFVTHYPSEKRPFYAMDDMENPEVTCSFDLLFRGLEVTTGGQRIHEFPGQIEKMRKRSMNVRDFESYLMAHKCGLPPHGGLGLGLERFTARLLAMENVRLAALFPRDISRVVP
ncbi:aspartate--tRNA(Asn) ligase [Roseburia hominis]